MNLYNDKVVKYKNKNYLNGRSRVLDIFLLSNYILI